MEEVSRWREWRHSPCLMSPLTLILLAAMALLSLVTLALQFPALVLGFLLGPLIGRHSWIVEFLYPTAAGRWVHFFILRMIARGRASATAATQRTNDKNRGYHSRALECRIEVIPQRIFIHPLTQLLDNLGYLVVCCPASTRSGKPVKDGMVVLNSTSTPLGKIHVTEEHDDRIVAFVVDCGDADAVLKQIKLISETFYCTQKIYVQSILSTHKHHDHTAGNRQLISSRDGHTIARVFGGAVEKVPCCNFPLRNGDMLPLPTHGDNDMNELIEIEAVATPAHTRGSLTYALRPKVPHLGSGDAYLFTGDTMFSAGGGVPFEADFEKQQEENDSRMTANSFLRISASIHAIECCFAEIIYRSLPISRDDIFLEKNTALAERVLVMPGHEYTSELLVRQMSAAGSESCRWKNFTPAAFFETVSQMYVAMHRRTLPHTSGRLLVAPSPMRRELLINPHLRMLQKRGELILQAIRLWNQHFAKNKVPSSIHHPSNESQNNSTYNGNGSVRHRKPSSSFKSLSVHSRWNLDANDLNRDVFTTVYSKDLNCLIEELSMGEVDGRTAALRLQQMKSMLNVPTVGRRPLPGTLPTDKMIYKGLLGFALLGSTPTALTLSDSHLMRLPPPIVSSSDRIRISKERLISVLYWLGLLSDDNDGRRVIAILDQLWQEIVEYSIKRNMIPKQHNGGGSIADSPTYGASQDEEISRSHHIEYDRVELGALKWILYGVPTRRPTWLPRFCLPCSSSSSSSSVLAEKHPIHKSKMLRQSGELVRHDVFTCALCQSAAGCPVADDEETAAAMAANHLSLSISQLQLHEEHDDPQQCAGTPGSMPHTTTQHFASSVTDEGDDESYIEVVTNMLREV